MAKDASAPSAGSNRCLTPSRSSSLIALGFSVATYFRDARRQKKLDTLRAYEHLQETVFEKLNQWKPAAIREAAKDPLSADYKKLSSYLAEIKAFCIGIEAGIYDYDTFCRLAHGYFVSNCGLLRRRLEPLLEAKRKNGGEDYYECIPRLWTRMGRITKKQRGIPSVSPFFS